MTATVEPARAHIVTGRSWTRSVSVAMMDIREMFVLVTDLEMAVQRPR